VQGRRLIVLAVITALGGALRFTTLGIQSFWFDEGVTVWLVHMNIGEMLETIPKTELTPPLYYVLAWGWVRLFGTDELGLRSLSALAGTATVPIVYAAAAVLVSHRVAAVAAALVAVNPFLIWYSQEARSYELLLALGALSFLTFIVALRKPTHRKLAGWAVVSALALATHYFAVFLVAVEGAWLIVATRPRRSAAVAAAGVAAAGIALLPLALHQRSSVANPYFRGSDFGPRLRSVPKFFLVGESAPSSKVLAVMAGLLVLIAVWLVLRRADATERRGARIAAAVGTLAVAVPVGLAMVGLDYILPRNVIIALPPLVVAVAIGFGARRAQVRGIAAAIALCALSSGIVVAVATDRSFQREDWRDAASALGTRAQPRAILAGPLSGPRLKVRLPLPLEFYRPELKPMPPRGAQVREVDIIEFGRVPLRLGHLAAFQRFQRLHSEGFTLLRLTFPRPHRVTLRGLAPGRVGRDSEMLFLSPGRDPRETGSLSPPADAPPAPRTGGAGQRAVARSLPPSGLPLAARAFGAVKDRRGRGRRTADLVRALR
jgi:mannosyltransferase